MNTAENVENLYNSIKKEKEELELILSRSGSNLERIEELKENEFKDL